MGACPRKKVKQDRTTKKGTIALYFTRGEALANDNATKFGTGVDVQDIITTPVGNDIPA